MHSVCKTELRIDNKRAYTPTFYLISFHLALMANAPLEAVERRI